MGDLANVASWWRKIALQQPVNTKPGQGSGSWAKRTAIVMGVNTKPGGGHGSAERRIVEFRGAKQNRGSWSRRLSLEAIRIGQEPWAQIAFDGGTLIPSAPGGTSYIATFLSMGQY